MSNHKNLSDFENIIATFAHQCIKKQTNKAKHIGSLVKIKQTDDPNVFDIYFACKTPGYNDWNWVVTIATTDDSNNDSAEKNDSKCLCLETVLLPTEQALLAPPWQSWVKNLNPSELRPTDILPYLPDDPDLVKNEHYKASSTQEDVSEDKEDQTEQMLAVASQKGKRLLNAKARQEIATRWIENSGGPNAVSAKISEEACASCGFFIELKGPLGERFGVCSNKAAFDDGKVVSNDHGCGSHSETTMTLNDLKWEKTPVYIDYIVK